MAKRALIVGISDYAPVAHDLPSATIDVADWSDLLARAYGFSQIRCLLNEQATRSAVADRLTWLLSHAERGDQLVFIFCGHGIRVPARRATAGKNDLYDEAILLHPGAAADSLETALWDDELTDLYRSMSVPPGALPTFILDSCFSAGVDFAELPILNGPPAPPPGLSLCDSSAFGLTRFGLQLTYAAPSVAPLIIASTGAASVAREKEDVHGIRSLFSELAITALRATPALSCEQLLHAITPRMRYAGQQPTVRGDVARIQKSFLE